jgi:hypothetical protein
MLEPQIHDLRGNRGNSGGASHSEIAGSADFAGWRVYTNNIGPDAKEL